MGIPVIPVLLVLVVAAMAGGRRRSRRGVTSRRITKISQLNAIDGKKLIVFVFQPGEQDPLVAKFMQYTAKGVRFFAISFGVVQAWEGLMDFEIERRSALIAVDVDQDRKEAFEIEDADDLDFAVQDALDLLGSGEAAEAVFLGEER